MCDRWAPAWPPVDRKACTLRRRASDVNRSPKEWATETHSNQTDYEIMPNTPGCVLKG